MPTEARSITAVQARLLSLLDEVLAHDGYGSIRVDVRLLKKGQKEVIVDCGKQYRYVVDFLPSVGPSPARSPVLAHDLAHDPALPNAVIAR